MPTTCGLCLSKAFQLNFTTERKRSSILVTTWNCEKYLWLTRRGLKMPREQNADGWILQAVTPAMALALMRFAECLNENGMCNLYHKWLIHMSILHLSCFIIMCREVMQKMWHGHTCQYELNLLVVSHLCFSFPSTCHSITWSINGSNSLTNMSLTVNLAILTTWCDTMTMTMTNEVWKIK